MIESAFVRKGDLLYRKNVGLVLINREGMVFVGRRFGSTQALIWQMPQGGMKDEETEEESLTREVMEEIGLSEVEFRVLNKTKDHHFYVIPEKMRKSVWNNIYAGQRQRWFLAEFLGKDQDICIHTEFPEFCEWRWEAPNNVLKTAISFKRDIYEKVLKEFNLI